MAPYVSPSMQGAQTAPYDGAMLRLAVSAAIIDDKLACDSRFGVALGEGDGVDERPALGETDGLRITDRDGEEDGDRETVALAVEDTGEDDGDAVGVMELESERKTELILGCGACAGVSRPVHGVHDGGRRSRSTRPSAPGRPAPPPAFRGVCVSEPVIASISNGQRSADGFELPPPLMGAPQQLLVLPMPPHQPPPPPLAPQRCKPDKHMP